MQLHLYNAVPAADVQAEGSQIVHLTKTGGVNGCVVCGGAQQVCQVIQQQHAACNSRQQHRIGSSAASRGNQCTVETAGKLSKDGGAPCAACQVPCAYGDAGIRAGDCGLFDWLT